MSQQGILQDLTTASADIETITGDGSTAVGPDSSHNINLVGGSSTTNDTDGITIVEDAGNNKLTVTLTNRQVGSGQTIGAVTADLITFGLGSTAGTYRFEIDVASFESTTPAGGGYSIDCTARTTGSAATIIATPFQDVDEDTVVLGAKVEIVASSNNIIVRATGVTALTINWLAKLDYIFVS